MRTYSIGHAALLSDIALRCGVICRGRDIDIAPRQQRSQVSFSTRRRRREKGEAYQRYARYSMMTMIKQTMADLMTNAEMKVKAMATTSITVATTRTGLNNCKSEYQFDSIQFGQRGSDVNWYNGML
jgi:hypothetical protein